MNKTLFNIIFFIAVSFWSTSAFSKVPKKCEQFFTPGLSHTVQVHNYLESTLKSFESMRGQNGLVNDTIRIRSDRQRQLYVQTLNTNTSPTNIAIDLLIQGELALKPKTSGQAKKQISHIISVLEQVDFHLDTGLFFTRYSTEKTLAVTDYSVSSIDNFHLALALWTIKENFGKTAVGRRAGELFNRMDFSVYLDKSSGLIGGNLKYENGKWIKEEYNFANFGSEARALYSAGFALGLFKKHTISEYDIKKSFAFIKAEVLQSKEGSLLKLWDGAAFQLFFPKIFVGEENYSPVLDGMFKNIGKYMVAEGERRGLSVPASHSAVRAGIKEGGQRPIYQDKAGNKDLVSTDSRDVLEPHFAGKWDSVFTPYALFMAATADHSLLSHFSKIENVQSGLNKLYSQDLGWMDGLHVAADLKGQVVPAQLSLNQGMVALSLLEIEASDGMSLSARALYRNPETRARLKLFYKYFDEKINNLTTMP